jgi:GNAT superfamily N-acetyltransferase
MFQLDHLAYRPATADDVPRCIVLRGMTRQNAIPVERLASYGITAASWGDAVRQGRQIGFVALQRSEIVGYCFGDTTCGEVLVLALLPAHEGQGAGRQLLGRVVERLVALGQRRLFLGCSTDPASRSHGFYRHLGWTPTGRLDAHGDEVLEYDAGNPQPLPTG